MSKPQKKRVNSRWVRGAQRYDEKTEKLIGERYHESAGWHKGAKVRRVGQ
jgi:hypothetical protein